MAPTTEQALAVLRKAARNHPGASGGEVRAHRILRSFTHSEPCAIGEEFVGLDAQLQHAVIQILVDLAAGKTGLIELLE